jgi:hypothetical protein
MCRMLSHHRIAPPAELEIFCRHPEACGCSYDDADSGPTGSMPQQQSSGIGTQ